MRWIPLAFVVAACSAEAQIVGHARVIDGDTLIVNGQRIRLEGIDAPEMRQVCQWKGKGFTCGRWSARMLRAMIDHRKVRCREEGRDRYRRVLATCWVAQYNLNYHMVRRGAALAYRRYSTAYVPAEDIARQERAGLWQMKFIPPWEWRAQRRN